MPGKRGMKYVRKNFSTYELEGAVEDVIAFITASSEGLDEARVEHEWDYDWVISGYRPMTPEELAVARKNSKAQKQKREREAAAQEKQERELLLRLKRKYEGGEDA